MHACAPQRSLNKRIAAGRPAPTYVFWAEQEYPGGGGGGGVGGGVGGGGGPGPGGGGGGGMGVHGVSPRMYTVPFAWYSGASH